MISIVLQESETKPSTSSDEFEICGIILFVCVVRCHVLLLSSTMLHVDLVNSMSCIVYAVFDHASCRSCRQFVSLSSTMLQAGLLLLLSPAMLCVSLVDIICHLLL